MNKVSISFLLFVLIFVTIKIDGQQILQSKEFNIRNDDFYDLFYLNNDKVALYRSKENVHSIDLLSKNLEFEKSIELDFESKRISVESAIYRDSIFKLLYTYRDGNFHYIKVKNYDNSFLEKDTTKILLVDKIRPINGSYKATTSADKRLTLLFGVEYRDMKFILIDNTKDSILGYSSLHFDKMNLKDDFRKIVLTNSGKMYMLFEKNNEKYNREGHKLVLFESTETGEFLVTDLNLFNTVNTNIKMSYDNKTSQLVVAGLFGEKSKDDLIGYFTAIVDGKGNSGKVIYNEFDNELYSDLYGKSYKKQKDIRDFYIKEIIHREDGGCVIIAEMQKEFVRRSSYSSISRFNGNTTSMKGFVDYYHEDLLIFSINNEGYEDWRKVLYKKQFSQDDDGAFSSFFTILTPSRIRIIYNDEIKKNSTVSEYILSPSGKFERNAILNTEYQDLQLRFRNAEQISSNEILVPSEKNNKLTIVKIKI